MRSNAYFGAALLTAVLSLESATLAQSASQRLRPLGAPSAVDQYRSGSTTNRVRAMNSSSDSRFETSARNTTVRNVASRNVAAHWQPNIIPAGAQRQRIEQRGEQRIGQPVRQTVMMQDFSFPADAGIPPASPAPPQSTGATTRAPLPDSAPAQFSTTPGAPVTNTPAPGSIVGGSPARPLPAPPARISNVVSPSDVTPMPQPSLPGQGFATIDNCNLITAQSNYLAAGGYGCGAVLPTNYSGQVGAPITSPLGGIAPTTLPAQIPSAATLPPVSAFPSGAASAIGGAAPARALVSLGQENYPVQVGQGLWGQPVAYVPGQSVRNWVRYVFP